eukprot:scaffold193172_cov36-Cyclotella_meneghiniana.AAC.3
MASRSTDRICRGSTMSDVEIMKLRGSNKNAMLLNYFSNVILQALTTLIQSNDGKKCVILTMTHFFPKTTAFRKLANSNPYIHTKNDLILVCKRVMHGEAYFGKGCGLNYLPETVYNMDRSIDEFNRHLDFSDLFVHLVDKKGLTLKHDSSSLPQFILCLREQALKQTHFLEYRGRVDALYKPFCVIKQVHRNTSQRGVMYSSTPCWNGTVDSYHLNKLGEAKRYLQWNFWESINLHPKDFMVDYFCFPRLGIAMQMKPGDVQGPATNWTVPLWVLMVCSGDM